MMLETVSALKYRRLAYPQRHLEILIQRNYEIEREGADWKTTRELNWTMVPVGKQEVARVVCCLDVYILEAGCFIIMDHQLIIMAPC